MSKLLTKAFAEASKLPESEQEALAAWILEELAADRRWQEALTDSGEFLAQLADEAVSEHREHRTQALDPDTL
ncbi:MAG: hypothetical protein HY690_17765 [Chloroflexi bacterium]|nr:hypothetical protein [Chloroflexota bacterium]